MSDGARLSDQSDTQPRPRLLYVAMYDVKDEDSGPRVRIRMLGDALGRIADLETIRGGRRGRIFPWLRWLARSGMGSVDAVYVESSTSAVSPIDLVLLAWARAKRRPVGVYFRDAYQLYRAIYPRTRRRQILADLAWRATMPLLRGIATVRFTPSFGLARALGIHEPVLLPPGTDPDLTRPMLGSEPVVAYVGAVSRADGFDRLLAAMDLVRRRVPRARLRVIGPPITGELPDWVDAGVGPRSELADRVGDARVCVVPRPMNDYSDLAMPIKVMDYLSLAKPIVATATGETLAFLGESGAAILVGDEPVELADAIARVLVEPGLAEGLARRAGELAKRPDITWDGRARVVLASLLPSRGHGR